MKPTDTLAQIFRVAPLASAKTVAKWHSRSLLLSLCGLIAAQPIGLLAAPAQQPLFDISSKSIPPNVFYTLDDSGSMSYILTPDALGIDISEAAEGRWLVLTPYEIDYPETRANGGGAPRCVVPTHSPLGALYSAVTALEFVKIRSFADNTSYYNPSIRYRPWVKPDGTYFPDVNPAQAPVDPLLQIQGVTGSPISSADVRIINTVDLTIEEVSINPSRPGTIDTEEAISIPYWCPKVGGVLGDDERKFAPALYFIKTGVANYTAVNINNPAVTSFTKHPDRTDCAGSVCSRAEERVNFANWYTYYRTRTHLAAAAAAKAFSAQTKYPFRLGYGQINFASFIPENTSRSATVMRGVRDFIPGNADHTNFFKFLYKTPSAGGTPLRRAMDDVGRYFQVTGDTGPWGNNPGGATTNPPGTSECRKSFHLLMTDGYWNGDPAQVAIHNVNIDGNPGPTIQNNSEGKIYKYNPNAGGPTNINIYEDNYAGTLADVAMYYWNRDLQPGIANEVPPASGSDPVNDLGDHAFWQHLATYTVGLGVRGTITSRPPPTSAATRINWPQPVEAENTTVDDLYHAAVNGRGVFSQANNVAEFEAAIDKFFADINASTSGSSGSALTSLVFGSGSNNQRFVTEYLPGVWSGDVKAYNTDSTGSITTLLWSANEQLPVASSRSIFTWNDSSSSGVSFDSSMPANLLDPVLWGIAPNADLINFLRGDRSKEGTVYRCRGEQPSTINCAGAIAAGKGKLGDIVNSAPVFVKAGLDEVYEYLPSTVPGANTYRTYVTEKRKRGTGVVFVGGNDGMLHGFNEQTGQELFAFVPTGVFGKLSALSDINYGSTSIEGKSHQYYVDGPLKEADAYINSQWTNLILGSAGAGGKSVFAISIDTPTAVTPSPAPAPSFSADNVQWELTDHNHDDLGYVMQPIQTGIMKNGNWVAIFGNGWESTNGRAHLFIVNLANGSVIKTIQAGTATGNGLGGVTLLHDANRMVVGAYAGDFTGKVWRFDLESTSPGDWKVGLGNNHLFDAGKTITAAPATIVHPQRGVLVIAGTGNMAYAADATDTSLQTLYGLWDETVIGLASASTAPISSSNLVAQTFTPTTVAGDPRQYWTLSNNTIDWTTQKGWKMDLTLASGQRHVFEPDVVGQVVLVRTVALPTGGAVAGACPKPVIIPQHNLLFNPINGGRVYTVNWSAALTDFAGQHDLILIPGEGIAVTPGDNSGLGGDLLKLGSPLGRTLPERNWQQIFNFPK